MLVGRRHDADHRHADHPQARQHPVLGAETDASRPARYARCRVPVRRRSSPATGRPRCCRPSRRSGAGCARWPRPAARPASIDAQLTLVETVDPRLKRIPGCRSRRRRWAGCAAGWPGRDTQRPALPWSIRCAEHRDAGPLRRRGRCRCSASARAGSSAADRRRRSATSFPSLVLGRLIERRKREIRERASRCARSVHRLRRGGLRSRPGDREGLRRARTHLSGARLRAAH